MKKRFYKKAQEEKKIAKERIEDLFKQASDVFKQDSELADRYVELARKIAMKCKVRIRSELKRKFCKHCYRYLVPSVNCRVRIQDGKTVYYCYSCKKFMRFPHSKKKK